MYGTFVQVSLIKELFYLGTLFFSYFHLTFIVMKLSVCGSNKIAKFGTYAFISSWKCFLRLKIVTVFPLAIDKLIVIPRLWF